MKTKLPRIPGFKNAPKVNRLFTYNRGEQFRVEQSVFWQDGSVCGPYKFT